MMIWVNFLPWRQRRRQRELYRWLARALTPLLLGISLLTTAGWQLDDENRRWRERIARRQEAIAQADALATRLVHSRQEQHRLQAVQQQRLQRLQHNRRWHQFFQQLAQLMPERLWLTTIKKRAGSVNIIGFCHQLAEIDEFRQRLRSLMLFRQIDSLGIARQASGQLQFTLLAKEAVDE